MSNENGNEILLKAAARRVLKECQLNADENSIFRADLLLLAGHILMNAAPQDQPMDCSTSVKAPAVAAGNNDQRRKVSDIAFERYEAEYERVLYMEKAYEMFGPEHEKMARRAMIDLAVAECSRPIEAWS